MLSKEEFREQLRVSGDLIALAIGSTWLVMLLVGTRTGRMVLVAMTDTELFRYLLARALRFIRAGANTRLRKQSRIDKARFSLQSTSQETTPER
jgi:hypothetical protein